MIVTTRYYGPTDSRGSRIRVMWEDENHYLRRKFVPLNYAASFASVSAISTALNVPASRVHHLGRIPGTMDSLYELRGLDA